MRYILPLVLFFLPLTTFAHVKWFTEAGIATPAYSFTNWQVWVWIMATAAVVFIAYKLEGKFKAPHIPEKFKSTVLTLADIGIGLSFLFFSYHGFVFAPNIVVDGALGQGLLILQTIIGLCYVFGFYTRVAALGLIVMWFGGLFHYGWLEIMDTLEILGFGIYGVLAGHPTWRLKESQTLKKATEKFSMYSLPLLRVFIGLNLIGLGLGEKILRPDLGLAFLSQYHWNFMEHLGFVFSDYWFVFSAGAAEMLIGILLVLGLLTRTTMLILSGFLITTLILLGPIELVGHLPHFSLAVVLLLLGSGPRLKIK